jgi:hypothetical protein
MPLEQEAPISLWTCLHDGMLEDLSSDLFARTITLTVDSYLHREFHKLPSQTRIKIVGEGVQSKTAFAFEPWPSSDPPIREDSQRCRYICPDWSLYASELETGEQRIVLEAGLRSGETETELTLGIDGQSNWREIEIRAENFRFFVGDKELSLKELQEFGDAYWNHFARNSETTPSNEKEVTNDV